MTYTRDYSWELLELLYKHPLHCLKLIIHIFKDFLARRQVLRSSSIIILAPILIERPDIEPFFKLPFSSLERFLPNFCILFSLGPSRSAFCAPFSKVSMA